MASTNVKAGLVPWQIAVKIPANPYVTKLERSGDATTHIYSVLFSRIGSLPENIICC
jgi:hypothetical protein